MLALWKGITWSEGFRVGWLLTWRAFVYGFVVGAVIGFVIGFVGAIIGTNPAKHILVVVCPAHFRQPLCRLAGNRFSDATQAVQGVSPPHRARGTVASGLGWRFISFLRNFKAALRSLFFETNASSTSPSWSTARQR